MKAVVARRRLTNHVFQSERSSSPNSVVQKWFFTGLEKRQRRASFRPFRSFSLFKTHCKTERWGSRVEETEHSTSRAQPDVFFWREPENSSKTCNTPSQKIGSHSSWWENSICLVPYKTSLILCCSQYAHSDVLISGL